MLEEVAVISRMNLGRRDQLAYLALYYAIHGDNERSEKIRRKVRHMENRGPKIKAVVSEPVGV